MQYPGKLPGISKIKHISAITHQNSTKFETQALLSPSIKTKAKKCTYPCSFPANYPASAKSSISLPLLIRIKPNLKLKLPLAQVSRPKPKNALICAVSRQTTRHQHNQAPLSPHIKTKAKKNHLSMQFPSKLPGISKIKHISALTHQNSTKFET